MVSTRVLRLVAAMLVIVAILLVSHSPKPTSMVTVPVLPLRTLHIFLISADWARAARAFHALNNAVYPKRSLLAVNLVVVVERIAISDIDMVWRHGGFRIRTALIPLSPVNNVSLVLVIEETMEVSPFFVFWFLDRWNKSVVIGGGRDKSSPMGIAFGDNLFARIQMDRPFPSPTRFLHDLLVMCNCTVVFPVMDDGRVFVRKGWQNPYLAEQSPRLVRTMRFYHEVIGFSGMKYHQVCAFC